MFLLKVKQLFAMRALNNLQNSGCVMLVGISVKTECEMYLKHHKSDLCKELLSLWFYAFFFFFVVVH
jgi:hypothetical protein